MASRGGYWDKVAESVAAVVRRREIDVLLHFTQLEHLPTILDYGLRTGSEVQEAGGNAGNRLDERYDAVSVSISCFYPKLFAAKRHRAGNVPFVILGIYPSLLWESHCLFHRSTAAGTDSKSRTGKRYGKWALEELFEDRSPDGFPGGVGFRESHGLPSSWPTYADAEVQVIGAVNASYIGGAWVETEDHREYVDATFRAVNRKDYLVEVAPFTPRIRSGQFSWG